VSSEAHKRPSIEADLVADVSKAKKQLGWKPSTDFATMIGLMVDSELKVLHHSQDV
jgi:GDP-D-mannose dehydratase